MYCGVCGAEKSDEAAEYCGKCGSRYDGRETAAPVLPAAAGEALPGLQTTSVVKLALLQIITSGLYAVFWLMKRREAFNNLKSEAKVTERSLIVIACFLAAGLMFTLFSVLLHSQGGQVFNGLGNISRFIGSIGALVMVFKYRRILREHLGSARTGIRLEGFLSALWTLIFGVIYLQYTINRLQEKA